MELVSQLEIRPTTILPHEMLFFTMHRGPMRKFLVLACLIDERDDSKGGVDGEQRKKGK